jgi:hypothetical protein
MSDPTPEDDMEALRREASELMPDDECKRLRLKWFREHSALREVLYGLAYIEEQVNILEETEPGARDVEEDRECLNEIRETIRETRVEIGELREQLLTLKSCIVTMFGEDEK